MISFFFFFPLSIENQSPLFVAVATFSPNRREVEVATIMTAAAVVVVVVVDYHHEV